jgi:hypothetical protein
MLCCIRVVLSRKEKGEEWVGGESTPDERKLQYSRGNIFGFINTGYFTRDNVPDGFKNATHNTFSNFRKKPTMSMVPSTTGS